MENPFTSGKNNPVADPSGQARPTIVLFKEGIRRDYTGQNKAYFFIQILLKNGNTGDFMEKVLTATCALRDR